jgi:hypothetical protein
MSSRAAGAPVARAGTAESATAREPALLAAVALAFVLWVCWTAATYLLEGRLLTLLRPEAVGGRVLYLLVANLALGTAGAGLVLRRMVRTGTATTRLVGFPGVRRSAVALLAGGVLGFVVYIVQGAPTLDPVILLNGLAQVLVVSIPEVLVCWSVAGGALEGALTPRIGRWSTAVALLGAAVLFGTYHYAHSPPFNTLAMVVVLTVVGLVTGIFFFVSRSVYGTIAFHNFMAALGVLRALDQAGRLDAYTSLQPALVGSAVIAVATLVAVHVFWLRAAVNSSTNAA